MNRGIEYRSEKAINNYVRVVLTLLSIALLMGPAAVLLFVQRHEGVKFAVIILRTLSFSRVFAMASPQGRRVEHLACTCAYTPALVGKDTLSSITIRLNVADSE